MFALFLFCRCSSILRRFSTLESTTLFPSPPTEYLSQQPSSAVDNGLLSSHDKKNIKLIPIGPAVCFATTTSTSTVNCTNSSATSSNSNGPVFVPVIDISGKKYLPVYLKQSTEVANHHQSNSKVQSEKMPVRSANILSQLISGTPLISSKREPTIVEENEFEHQRNFTPQPLSYPNVNVERLSMSQLDLIPTRDGGQSRLKTFEPSDNSIINNKCTVKVPQYTRRSPEAQKNLRAKTVRIGKIRWPPPLNPEEKDNADQHRRMLVQRRIQEEILGGDSGKNGARRTTDFDGSAGAVSIEHPSPPAPPPPPPAPAANRSQSIHNIQRSSIEQKHSITVESRRAQSDERRPPSSSKSRSTPTDQPKKSSLMNTSLDQTSPLPHSEDDELSTNEIVATNQSRQDFHKTMTPMIGKENFELRKKMFEHPDDLLFGDPNTSANVTPSNDAVITSKPPSRQSLVYLTYDNIPWKFKIRKEVFSPNESLDNPLLIELLYLQIVHDTFSPVCVRVSDAERTNMKTFLASHSVATIGDISSIKKISAKKFIIEQARQWPTYFCRLFPVSMPKYHSGEVQMLGVSHSGVRLIKRRRTVNAADTLQVLETFSLDAIQQVSTIRNGSTIDLRLSKKRITIHSHRVLKIKQLIESFLQDARLESHKNSHTPVSKKKQEEKCTPPPLSNTSDLFKSSSQVSLMSCSQTFSELIPSASLDAHTPKPTKSDMHLPSVSALPSGHSMMEFALQNFKVPNRRRSKKSWKTSEWTWQDYTELIKWSKNPIQAPLLRHSSNEITRIARQCFLCIMRFMGDHPLARGQTDTDCLLYLLKNMHKHRALIDEVLCQMVKQLTNNKSAKNDSVQRGWKLLAILMNYFIPSEHLRPYFVKYLNDSIGQNEKFAQLCLNHYEQTLKFGGRKNTPSKAEIDLATASGRGGGKRQTFLLPGGVPLILLTTPSMVIGDCLNLLCERLNLQNGLEYDEYSILIISATENSSRLLSPTEYLFDILSECSRLNMTDYHLIVKRMLWFNVPFSFDENGNKSETFIDFMYNQLVPELLEGTMIVLDQRHLSDELMQQISLLAALEYRASNKIGLPSMREVKHLLPATVLKLKSVRPQDWTAAVHEKLYSSVETMTATEAKMKFLTLIQTWPLLGTTFFGVQAVDDPSIKSPCLIGICKSGILFLDMDTRETLFSIPFNDVVSIRRHQNSIDIKYGSLNQPFILQCQVDRAQDLVALTGRYLSFIGRTLASGSDRKSDSQQLHRTSTSAYNDPISTIL